MVHLFKRRSEKVKEWTSPTRHSVSNSPQSDVEGPVQNSNVAAPGNTINQASAGIFKRPAQIKHARLSEDGRLRQSGAFIDYPDTRQSVLSQLTGQSHPRGISPVLAERSNRRSLRSSEPARVIQPEVYKYSKIQGLGKPWKTYVN